MLYCKHIRTIPQDPPVQIVLTWCHRFLNGQSAYEMLLRAIIIFLIAEQLYNVLHGT